MIVVVVVLIASLFEVCLVSCELNLFLSLLSSFSALCLSCVCLVFLDCGGLLLYGRWIAHVDALWPPGRRGVSWNESCSFLCYFFFLSFFNFLPIIL